MLSESCRPALNLTNHTPREKDSEGVTKLETEEEGRKKKKKKKKKKSKGLGVMGGKPIGTSQTTE